jgi:acetyl esterase/lipase
MAGRPLVALLLIAILPGCVMLQGPAKHDTVVFADSPETLQADLYLPDDRSQAVPAVVVVHGGSWVRRSGDMQSISRQLAAAGFAALNISYRSAEDYPYPAAVDDVRLAITWLRDNARRYNIDPHRIGGWGYSAGGQLILRAGLDPRVGLSAIVSGGTPAQFSYWPQSPIITQFIGQPYDQAKSLWEDASPVNHVTPESPAVFLYHGAEDDLVEPIQMEIMADALRQQQVPVQTRLIEDNGHIATYLFAGDTEREAIEFLRRKL